MEGSSFMFAKRYLLSLLLISLFTVGFKINAHEQAGLINKDWTLLGSFKTENFHRSFEFLSRHHIDIAGVDYHNKIIDILLDDNEFIHLSKYGLDISITQTKGVFKGPDQEYKNPEEIEFLLTEFRDKFPSISKLTSIGKSLEGRDIWALKISDNPEMEEHNEPSILFNSMHHAREIMTPEISLDIIQTLLEGYQSDADITNWINQYETDASCFKSKSWLKQAPTAKQLALLRPDYQLDFNLTRYQASLLLQFQFNKSIIHKLIRKAAI